MQRLILRHLTIKTVKTPSLADSITEGTLSIWHKNIGEFVSRDSIIATLETDKVDVVVNSSVSGVVTNLYAKDLYIGYSYSKRMIDVMNNVFNSQYNCNFTSIIPCNVYGPHDNFNLIQGHVIPALIHKAYLAKLNNTTLKVCGTGAAMRQFIHSYDLGNLILWVLDNYNQVDPIITSVGGDQEISIKDAVGCICKAIGFNGVVEWDNGNDGQFKKTVCNKKLTSLVEYKFLDFEEGINQACQWFIDNYESSRK